MTKFPVCRLGDIANVVAGDPAPQERGAFAADGPLFVRMQDVGLHHVNQALTSSADRLSPNWLTKNHLRLFPKDSILIPKSGASVNLNHRAKLATHAHVVSHLAVVMPNTDRVDPDYLFWWSVRYDPRAQAQVTSLPSLKLSALKEAPVPLPPLDEQRRIVGILNRAAKIERLRGQAQERLREFIPTLFIKMFGDPVQNPYGHHQQTLSECANFISGATPSKQNGPYWDGEIPWISPKDMKVDLISDSENHVSNLAFADTSLKAVPANTPIIVVRGMILSHTVPIALTARTVAINQDMKAIDFDSAIDPVFGFWCLKVLQQRILDDVDTAAHGTKRIEMTRLGAVPMHLPSRDQQRRYVQLVERARSTVAVAASGSRVASTLNNSLMSRLLGADA